MRRVVGVVVLGDDGLQPWRNHRSRGSRVEKEEELHEAGSSDSESLIDRMFDEAVHDREEDHQQRAVGLLQSALQRHTDPEAAEQVEEVISAPKRKHFQPKARGEDALDDIVGKRRRLVRTLSEISDLVEDEGGTTKQKGGKAKAKPKCKKLAPGGAGGGGGGGASKSRGGALAGATPRDTAPGGAAQGGEQADSARSVGRPAQDPACILQEVRKEFVTARGEVLVLRRAVCGEVAADPSCGGEGR